MVARTVYEARVAVAAAGLEQRQGLQETCCVVALQHEELGSNLLLQELCSGWRPGGAPVYSSTTKPFSLAVGDGDMAAVSDASIILTVYARVQRQKQGALFSCLGHPVTSVEVILQRELPLQQVLMAATMSCVHQLQLPGGGKVRCEIALSKPQHGNGLLVGVHGEHGLDVLDAEENTVMRVQAVRLGPQRTSQEAKRRHSSTGSSSWLATDAATGRSKPAASPAYELQISAASADEGCAGSSQQHSDYSGAGSSPPPAQLTARCRMEPGSERYTVMVRDECSPEGFSAWAVLAVQQVAGQAGHAALQLQAPSLPGLQLVSSSITPVAHSVMSTSGSQGSASGAAAAGGPINKVHPNSCNGSATAAGSSSARQCRPLGVRYVLRQQQQQQQQQQQGTPRRSAERPPAAAAGGTGASSPRSSNGKASLMAEEPLACIAVAARDVEPTKQQQQQQQQQHSPPRHPHHHPHHDAGASEDTPPVAVFAIDLQRSAVSTKHAAGVVCLAALLAELT